MAELGDGGERAPAPPSPDSQDASASDGGGGRSTAPPPPPAVSGPRAREDSSNLLELAVVLCRPDGSEVRALGAVRCHRGENLDEIRGVIASGHGEDGVVGLPARYAFLRTVGGRTVAVSDRQERGRRAYKAKHFAPPRAESARLRVFDLDGDDSGGGFGAGGGAAPAPPAQPTAREASAEMVEFCVRRMSEEDRSRTSVLGMARLHRDSTLAEVRRDLARQLRGAAPPEYRFVRLLEGGTAAVLTPAQEGSGSASWRKPLRAYHFAPPYTSRPELVLLTRRSYTEGEVIPDETKTRELKSLAGPMTKPQHRHPNGMDPRDVVKEKARNYINAFLNSSGGVLIFGANDDGVVERVPVSGLADKKCASPLDRKRLARVAKDDIRKLIDEVAQKMDPPVDDDLVTTQFVPVRRRPDDEGGGAEDGDMSLASTEEEEIYNVIEVHVKPGRRALYFVDKHLFEAYERRDGSTYAMDADAIADALNQPGGRRGRADDSQWKGGWRQLRSAFDFDALMRRLSDPWAGREWLFADVRQSLKDISEEGSPAAPCGIGIVGSRGAGKTSFLSELTLRPLNVTHLDVMAHHLCRADDPDTLSPALFVHSVAAQLAHGSRQYRSLMIESAANPSNESMGAAMLRALRPEHCDSDPDDAMLRGILKSLWEVDNRLRGGRCKRPGRERKAGTPVVLVVDALDESIKGVAEQVHGCSSSSTIAHLLERAVSNSGGFPQWMKLVVSFRKEMLKMPGPIQRLASRLKLINLDPDPTDDEGMKRAQEDIRLFVVAYMEKTKMSSPLGISAGGKWNPSTADVLGSGTNRCWEFSARPGVWSRVQRSVSKALLEAYDSGSQLHCYKVGKREFIADFEEGVLRNTASGKVQKIRLVTKGQPSLELTADLDGRKNEIEKKSKIPVGIAAGVSKGSSGPKSGVGGDAVGAVNGDKREGKPCFLCGEVGHLRVTCPNRESEPCSITKRKSLIMRECQLLDALAWQSHGNYLYARTVLEDIGSGSMSWEEVPSLPGGLDHLYASFFHRHFGEGSSIDGSDAAYGTGDGGPSFLVVRPVLEILLAAPKRGITEREIAHALVAGALCDPAAVTFCLRDVRWALDVELDGSGGPPRYRLGHESVKAWLEKSGNANPFRCQADRGHRLLAASLLQRCWPQQMALSRWLQSNSNEPSTFATAADGSMPPTLPAGMGITCSWYDWSRWEPKGDDIYNLVNHLALCDLGGDEERIELLQTVGKNLLNSVHGGGRNATALHSAALAGHVCAVNLLLGAGASPNISVSGRCPLHLAAGKGFSKTVRALLNSGADVASTTSSGRTALLCAAGRGSVSTVKCILDAVSDLERDFSDDAKKVAEARALLDASQTDSGRTPLSVAAEEGHDNVIMLLLEAKASVNLADRWGRTPIYFAARYGRVGPNTVKAMATAPGGQETLRWGQCGHNRSPLHAAVWHGHVDIVRALLESNADPNLVENDCGGPLHEAAYFGSYGNDKARAHLRKKEDPGSASEDEELARLEILRLLLDSGRCAVNQGEIHGCTPIWYAAGGGWTKAVEMLLDSGACIDPGELPCVPRKNRRGPASPLQLAIERGHYDTARVLLSRSARVPELFDIDSLQDLRQVPDDFVPALHAARIQQRDKEPITGPSYDVIPYTMAVKCEPVPREAFARWPPARQARDGVGGGVANQDDSAE